MKVATKFVAPLTSEETHALTQVMDTTRKKRVRIRAHTILLSSQGIAIDQIAHLYQVHRNSVSSWLDRWAEEGLAGLPDRPRSGSPPKLTPSEKALAKDLIRQHPNAIKQVRAHLYDQTGKSWSISSLRRLAKQMNLRWKRVRKSVKTKRDEQAFRTAEKELATLKKTSR